jgi:hypothetical protein
MRTLAVFTTLLLILESFWLFAWSAHVAPWLEKGAPTYLIVSVVLVWFSYSQFAKSKWSRGRFIAACCGCVGAGVLIASVVLVS